MRVFIALPIPQYIAESLAAIGMTLRDSYKGIKPVRINAVHLTMSFLGDQAQDKVELLKKLMQDALLSHKKFEVQLSSIGTFPGTGIPKVIWAGIGEGADALAAYQHFLKNFLVKNGFREAEEKRPFHPHLTVARNKFTAIPHNIIKEFSLRTEPFIIDRCILFQSILIPSGAEYTILSEKVFSQ